MQCVCTVWLISVRHLMGRLLIKKDRTINGDLTKDASLTRDQECAPVRSQPSLVVPSEAHWSFQTLFCNLHEHTH